ncbi:MAG TPA: cytochrome P450 [Pseudonocardiaceae bacterium]
MNSPVVLGEDFIQDRQALYRRLFEEGPVREAVMPDGLRVWLVTRYADAREVLASPKFSKDSRRAAPLHDQQEQEGVQRTFLAEVLTVHLLNVDPPDHTRLRRLIGKEFTARRVEQLRPWIEQVTDGLLDNMAGQDHVDLLGAFAFPLPVTVICELFGVPAADRERFRGLFNGIAFGASPDAIGRASEDMAAYLNELVVSKRSSQDDDLLSALIRASDEGDRLSEIELVSMSFLMLTAGFETTAHLIGNAVAGLLCNPDQLAALRADPALLPAVVEEVLRYAGPAGMTTLRFTTEPVVVGDVEIPAGEFVEVLLGGANRDPEVFDHPDSFDVRRKSASHLAFGHGIHHCVGAPLARLEGQIAIGRLLARFPDLALAVEPSALRWRNSVLFHGLEEVPLKLSRTGGTE